MTLAAALERFEMTIAPAWPAAFATLRPGADDATVRQLSEAVAPFGLPRQVEALYRWRAGGDSGVFGGWRMRDIDELLHQYRFTVDELGSPRTWLPVFDDQIVNIVTLDVPGRLSSDESVWWGHTHDVFLRRVFDSIEALLDVVCDACEADALAVTPGHPGRLGIPDAGGGNASLDGPPWESFRLARSPGSYRHADPPAGTNLSRSPDTGWPPAWHAVL